MIHLVRKPGVADPAVVVGRDHREPCLRPAEPSVPTPPSRRRSRRTGRSAPRSPRLPPLAADPARTTAIDVAIEPAVVEPAGADAGGYTRVDGTRYRPARAEPRTRRRCCDRSAAIAARRLGADQRHAVLRSTASRPCCRTDWRPTSIVRWPTARPCCRSALGVTTTSPVMRPPQGRAGRRNGGHAGARRRHDAPGRCRHGVTPAAAQRLRAAAHGDTGDRLGR